MGDQITHEEDLLITASYSVDNMVTLWEVGISTSLHFSFSALQWMGWKVDDDVQP